MAIGVAAAVAVGGVLYAADVLHLGDTPTTGNSPAAVDTTPVALPEELGGSVLQSAAIAGLDQSQPGQGTEMVEREARVNATTAAALAKAYGGAGAAVQTYTDADLMNSITAVAVRAPSPRLFLSRVTDPADLRLAVNRENIRTDGEVDCYTVQVKATVVGTVPDPADTAVDHCQRTGEHLTVRIYLGGRQDRNDPDRVATAVAMTNELWDAVAGSVG
ncbi:hypothetical protein D1871_17650 [Nakamurella silvestris]|nr:hypothetical protein D1871_17650 [Nakamurella silvestris]